MCRVGLLILAMPLPLLGGCAWHDLLFSAFGDYHSDGHTAADRQANYREQVDAIEHPRPY